MKFLFASFLTILFFISSCQLAQKMVQVPRDAKKLQVNKNEFVGKTFKTLLEAIKPEILYVYGNPDNKYAEGGRTSIKFFFLNKSEYREKNKSGGKPIGVLVSFKLEFNNNRKPIPVGGINTTTKELVENYGDMVIISIYVTGED